MSRVMYDSKRLIPAPLVSISKSYQKSGDGEIIGKIYGLTITGTIVAWMGSPQSDGTFWAAGGYPDNESVAASARLSSIQRKQEAIRYLFNTEGKCLEFQALDGSAPVKCYPRLIDINFAEGIWYDRCEYTITLECDELYGGPFSQEDSFSQYISDASENWSIDTNEEHAETLGIPKTYSLSHTISANGKRFYDETGALVKDPWEQAKTFVLSKLGFDSQMVVSSGVLNLPSYYQGFNHVRNENIDKKAGSYSVTENWLLSSGNATEVFSVQTSDQLESPYKTVSIDGTVTGYDERDTNLNLTTSKWANAETKFDSVDGFILTRAQQFSGLTLNIVPTTETIGRNPVQGTITYSYEYNTRPSNLITGAKSETISIADNVGGESFASVFVLGRAKGPVLQDLGTKPVNTRTLNIEIVVDPPTYADNSVASIKDVMIDKKPINNALYSSNIQNVIDAVDPNNNGFDVVFQDQPQDNWDFKNGRYSYNCTWTYE